MRSLLWRLKQIKKWIKVDRLGLWFNVHPMLKHNQAERYNSSTAFPVVQTSKCLSQCLKSTLVVGLWVTQHNGNHFQDSNKKNVATHQLND